MQYVRLDVVRYVTKADALTLGAAYSRPKGGRVPSPLEHAPALLATGRAGAYPRKRGLRFAPGTQALRGTSGGATLTTPGGSGTYSLLSTLPARPAGFSHRAGAPTLLGSGPSLCPGPMPQG
jgi:hypothetical protein